VIVAEGVDCHHERCPLYEVVQLELTQTLPLVETHAIGLHVTLEIEEGKSLTDL
jgi:hypothetical protein